MGEKEASEYDIGVLELEEELAEEYGYLGIDSRENNIKGVNEIEICGYPGDKKRRTMWSSKGSIEKNSFECFIKHLIPTEDGQSGSPLIKREKGREYVMGIHIGGNYDRVTNVALRFTKEKK